LWHKSVIVFQLSVKYRRVPTVGVAIGETVNIFAASPSIFVYPPAQNLELQTYITHSTIAGADN
jgi:hypothetical protein